MATTNITKVGVGVFVCHDGKILMGKRRGAHGAETWSIPGGHLEFGESPTDTAIREVCEETGLTIKNIRFGGLTSDYFEDVGKHYITIWMISDYSSGDLSIAEPDFYVDCGWYDFDNLPQPLFLPWTNLFASEFIEQIKQEVLNKS